MCSTRYQLTLTLPQLSAARRVVASYVQDNLYPRIDRLIHKDQDTSRLEQLSELLGEVLDVFDTILAEVEDERDC